MKRKSIQKIEAREEKVPRFLAQIISPWQQDTGIEAPRSYAFKDFLSVYGEGALANVWVFRAVRAISEAQAQLPLLLQAKNRKGEWETIQSGSLFRLFEDINPNMTYYDYTEAESIYMELTGNCFLALENPSPNTKLPREIWPIRPDLVRIHPDKETGEVLGYTVHLGEGQKPLLYPRNEMLHRKYFNPTNWFWGASPLQVYKMGLTFEYYTKQYENNFFKHGVRETGILTSGGSLNDKQFERLRKQVEARYGGIEMMHRPMVLEGGLDWKRISVPPKDMEYRELKRWNKDEAEAIYNIPPLKMMDMEAASKLANAEIQERMFWSDTIIPRLKKREGFYEEWLFPFFFKKSELFNYRLRHDLGEVKSLQVSEKDKAELAVKLTSGINPILSVDEARERFYSFGPAPWGGKEPLVPGNLMPASFVNTGGALTGGSQAERFFDVLAEKIVKKIKDNGERKLIEGEVLEIIKEEKEDDVIVDKYSEDYIWSIQPEFEVSEEQQLYWREWAVKRLKEEDRFVRSLNVEFRRELNETLNNLNKLNEGQLIPVKSLLFDESHAINNMRDIYLSNFGFIFRNVSSEEMSKWGLTNPTDYDSPTVLEYGRNQASRFAGTGRENLQPGQYPGVTGTQLNKLEGALNEGYQLGEGIPELTKRVQNTFAGTVREKGYAARRIARTETIRLANFSRLTQYQRNKHIVKQKQWLATLDQRTEEICVRLHGEVVDLDAAFPGGYMSPPDPHPNCRCLFGRTPIYTSKGWKKIKDIIEGELVLTHKGRFRKVLGVHRNKREKNTEVIKIYTPWLSRGGQWGKLSLTGEHEIFTDRGVIRADRLLGTRKIKMLAYKCKNCDKLIPIQAIHCSYSCSRSTIMKEAWKKKEFREIKINQAKEFSNREEVKEKRIKRIKDMWKDDSYKQKMSEKAKRQWEDKDFREFISQRNSFVMLKRLSEGTSPLQNPEVELKRIKGTQRYAKRATEKGIHVFQNPDIILKAQKAIAQGNKGSKLEKRMGDLLNIKLGLNFIPQFMVKAPLMKGKRRSSFFIDFARPDLKLGIECDGEYWHLKNEGYDFERQLYIERGEWQILRFSGQEIMGDIEGVGQEIQRVILNHERKYQFCEMSIKKIEKYKLKKNLIMYDLTVEEDESYLAHGWVVHNCALLPVIREKIEDVEGTGDIGNIDKLVDEYKSKFGVEMIADTIDKQSIKKFTEIRNLIFDYIDKEEIFRGKKVKPGNFLRGLPNGWSGSAGSEEAGYLKYYFSKKYNSPTIFHQDFLDRNKKLIDKFEISAKVSETRWFKEYSDLERERLMDRFEASHRYLMSRFGGFKEGKIKLYRGVSPEYFEAQDISAPLKGTEGNLTGNSLEGWSAKFGTARTFGLRGVVFETEASINDIVFSALGNGEFFFTEQEFVIKGKNIAYKVVESFIK